MRHPRPHVKTLLSILTLSASIGFTGYVTAAPHAHKHDNPGQQNRNHVQQAQNHTQALIALQKSLNIASRGAKAQIIEGLKSKADERNALLAELAKQDPAAVLNSAIPDTRQQGMPAEVLAKLEQRFNGEGELEVQYADFEDGTHELRHYLKTPFGERFRLHVAGKPGHLKQGQRVSVDGVLLAEGNQEDQNDGSVVLDSNNILTLALDGSGSEGEPGPMTNTLGEQRTLVIMMNFKDDQSQPWSKSQISDLVGGQVDNFMRENSYGQTWLNVDVAGWYTIDAYKSDGCATSQYSDLANAKAQSAGYNISNYDRLIYLWPSNSNCNFSGLGTVGGAPSKSWINGQGVWHIFAHEMGHNLGLGHSHDLVCGSTTLGSNCSVTEYGDYPDIMGGGHTGHFNAFQKDRLGWLGYGSAPELLTVTGDGTFTLSPYAAQDNGTKALKILKDINPNNGQKTWYYVEYRQALGFDSGLSESWLANFLNGATIHTGNKSESYSSYLLDMTPGSSLGMQDAALETGRSYSDNNAGVTITTNSLNSGSAQISISMNSQSCTQYAPQLTSSSSQSEWVAAGTTVSYTLTLKNNDSSACGSSSFNLNTAAPTGWNSSLSQSSVSLAPGASATITLNATSASNATDGFYNITTTAANGSRSANNTVTYVVSNPSSNTGPVAANDSASVVAGNSVTINVLANDSDADGDSLSITSVSGVNGSAVISGGSIVFTPAAGFSGTEVFNYSISDGNGGSDTASVTVTVSPQPTQNNAPTANNDSASVIAGSSVTINVLANDTDSDGDNLTITSVNGVNGSAVISGGSIVFTPAAGFTGTEVFNYSISDGKGGSDTASVTVTVSPQPTQNSAPIALNDSASVAKNSSVTISVLSNDSDPEGDQLTVVSATQGSKGSVRRNSNGTITYTPAKSFKSGDSFSYTISDGNKTATATVIISLQDDGSGGGTGGKGNGKKR